MSTGHDYRFLPSTGQLEIRCRVGFKLVSGCSCLGVFEYQDRMAELPELLHELGLEDAEKPLDALYLSHERFRYVCDRILTLNGIDPDWVRPRDIEWLIFGHYDEAGQLRPSPLQTLNAPQEPRYPRKPGRPGKSDRVALLAAIAANCGSLDEAFRVGTSQPARDVLGAMEERAWWSMTDEQRDDAKFKDWARRQQEAAEAVDVGGWGHG